MAANYNNSAWFYDRLSRLVYGRALINAQLYLLHYIEPGSRILIAGGGTGWILEELTRIHPSGLHITYVEVAADMMALSRKRNTGTNTMVYINEAIENVSFPGTFDTVITPFLFDNFTEQTLKTVFSHIHKTLRKNGLWLNASFQLTGKWWQRFLLKSMFLFFKVICGIEADRLPAIENHFTLKGYTAISEKTFFKDFVLARVYRSTVLIIPIST